MNIKQKLAVGRLTATRKAPYFSELLLNFVPHEAPGLGTVGCTKDMVFFYDPTVIKIWSVEVITFAWWHESLHILLKSADRLQSRDPRIWNIATDLTINEQGQLAGFKIPEWAALPSKFELPSNLTADEYYDALCQKEPSTVNKSLEALISHEMAFPSSPSAESESEAGSGGGKGKAKESQEKGQGESGGNGPQKLPPMSGGCGSCSGNHTPGEPDSEESGGRSDSDINNISRRTAEAIAKHSNNGQGRVPRGLLVWAQSQLEPPKIPWQQKLARAVRSAIAYRPGAVDYRYSKMSRRQAAIGYGPGKPVLPALIAPIPRVSIILDTSGSMGPEELKLGLSEAAGILQAVGAEVIFCACDSAVHTLQKVRSVSQLSELIKGGGGTDFRPAFKAVMKQREKPEVIIFATDGMGPAPSSPPIGVKVIWLLIGSYKKSPCEWGEHIEID